MKKLVLLSSSNINSLNGSAKFVKLFIDYRDIFKRESIDTIVYSNSKSFSDAKEYLVSRKYRLKTYIKKILSTTSCGQSIDICISLLLSGKKVVRNFKKGYDKESVILLNDIAVAYFVFKNRNLKNPTIFMMHNNGEPLKMLLERYPLVKKTPFNKYLKSIERTVLSSSSCIVFVSETARMHFVSLYPELEEKTRYIPIGIPDTQRRCPYNAESLKLITVGSVCKRKGQLLLIECIRAINNKNIELTVVGDGDQLEECQKFVKENRMEDQIHLKGAKKNVDDFLHENNVFILASEDEGLPIAAQEALRAGLPLILTDVGGCRECIDNNGLLISPEKKRIIEAINFVNSNRELWERWGTNSRMLYEERFSITMMSKRYSTLIDELVSRN